MYTNAMKPKTLYLEEYELPIKISEDPDGGFVAHCPLWLDCYSQGETVEETINEISSVAKSMIELYREENLLIPLDIV